MKSKNRNPKNSSAEQPPAIQLPSELELTFDPNEDVTPIVEFLDAFRQMVDVRAQNPSKLISMKIPEPLLAAFKFKSARLGVPYQTKIKELMLDWLRE